MLYPDTEYLEEFDTIFEMNKNMIGQLRSIEKDWGELEAKKLFPFRGG